MITSTTANNPLLCDFIDTLLDLPIQAERFTASFTLTGINSGQIYFRERGGQGEATAYWEAWLDGDQVQARLLYNQSFELLRTAGHCFKDRVACAFPIF